MQQQTALDPTIVRLADEGVPICAISRAAKLPSEIVRRVVNMALESGDLLQRPQDDWPSSSKRTNRLPALIKRDENLELDCISVFGFTPLCGHIFALFLRRENVTKDAVYQVIQDRRMMRGSDPGDFTNFKITDVLICHIRKKIKRHQFKIITVRGRGYHMEKEHREKAINMINKYNQDNQ